MAELLTLCVISLFFFQVQTDEQIVTNMTKVKGSSIYFKSFLASYAVDGDFNQNNIRRCFHTAVKKTIKEAWLQIDLGRVYRVSSVKLWYRSTNIYGSTYDNKKSRLPGFSIRVSNDTTVPTSRSSCYTSSKYDAMPTIIEKECKRTTRYVWIYQDQTSSGEKCPILEICEIQVFVQPPGLMHSLMTISSTTERLGNASQQLNSIIEDGKQDTKVFQETVSGILHMMKNTTFSIKGISAGDLNSTLDILEKIVNTTGPDIENEVFYAVIDNILSTNNSKSWTTLIKKKGKRASSILKNMDHLNEILMQKDNLTTPRFCGSNIELTINETNLDESDIRFPDILSNNTSDNDNEMPTFLELPKQHINVPKDMRCVAIIYKTLPDLLSKENHRNEKLEIQTGESTTNTFVNSPILSLTTQNDVGILDPPLALTFRHIVNNESNELHPVCVSWDFKTSKWTERGCKVKQSDHQKTVCLCNHLTNFAILMRPYFSVKEESNILKTMSFVGVVLSIAFAFITFVIYIMTWRYIKSEQNIMMLNMCGALIMSLVMFITTVEETHDGNLCVAITAIIHYLFLVTFCSMLGIGVYLFMSITVTYYAMYVANNFKSKPRIHWFLIGAWGLPAIITATNLGVFWGKGYHLKNYCWLSMKSGSLYLFIIPVCLINILNILIIVSLLRVLYASRTMSKSSLQQKASSGLRSLGTLVPVLGVTWILGMFAVDHKTDIFQYIFVIANSLQGVFIFVTHVLLNKKVRQGLCNTFQKLKTMTTSSGQNMKTSPTQSQPLSTTNAPMLKNKENALNETICSENAEKSKLMLAEKAEVMETPDILQATEWGKETIHNTSFLYTYNMSRGPK
ncbi:adhesion G protein-coupled receptor B1-like [Crassostrea angulata]|uniref:adhesion G protein-coupled receptor B1-like n=1 Tax=Magallana angulata TaxID=2784310 RepID=UPI0022B0BBA1|nr:adhesion G protein-coupled receptor B1-like [Crassostrea angulata]